jgi:hypothetical protein
VSLEASDIFSFASMWALNSFSFVMGARQANVVSFLPWGVGGGEEGRGRHVTIVCFKYVTRLPWSDFFFLMVMQHTCLMLLFLGGEHSKWSHMHKK